jgi:proton glutamate symport protein
MKLHNVSLKVLLGMVIGIVLGLVLMNNTPVPVQPKDRFEFSVGGQVVSATIAEAADAKPGLTTSPEMPIAAPDTVLVGTPMSEAQANLEKALGTKLDGVHLRERKEVKLRPPLLELVNIIGQGFIGLLKMLVIPLIISSVLVGIASLGGFRQLRRLGGQTFLIYLTSMAVAVGVGMVFVNLIRPGAGLVGKMPGAEGAATSAPTISEMVLRLIPSNPVKAMADFDVLGILTFTVLLAIAILHVGKHRAAPVFNFFESLADLMFVLIGWVMAIAPIGVGALIAYQIGIQNPDHLGGLLQSLGMFAATVASSLAVHFLILVGAVALIARYNPLRFLRHMTPAVLTAFGTNSSNATMPVTLSSVRSMGVSKRVSDFVVPVGATMNMDGTALFEAVAALFFAQAYGVELGLTQQIIIALTAILAAVGAAGIPSAGLVTMTLVLTAVGLPVAGIAMIFAIDRPLDMLRTVVNITGDAMTSRVVQTWNPDIRPEEDDLATEYEIVEPAASHGPEVITD